MKDVDVTGAIYFPSVFHYALEAFELFLSDRKTNLSDFFAKGYLFPVVHAEADYKFPLKIGDEVSISLRIKSISARSLTVETEIKNIFDEKIAAKVTLIHAFMHKGDQTSSEIPKDVLELLYF